MSLSRFSWYWHRLRAMNLAEMRAHVRKRLYQFADAGRQPIWDTIPLESSGSFPNLPDPIAAPAALREALRRDADEILKGDWRAFGHLEIKVDDPPRWQTDYLIGKDLATDESAFKLNHRNLPGGADIKMIWELSRWYQLVRLAQTAYVLDDAKAGQTCVRWLKDWVAQNTPYRGWNWTSALESGMRLVQFAWIHALLVGRAEVWGFKPQLEQLCQDILPPHVWFTWRYKSFGSSANNHLLGELTGLIVATVRWPAVAHWGASLDTLQAAWEHEVLAQFAEDGGNREQALNYQMFSWEFCWQARLALKRAREFMPRLMGSFSNLSRLAQLAAAEKIASRVEERLARAARFCWEVQVRREPWDYGDSDNAFVTPLFTAERTALQEWRDWLRPAASKSSLEYWLGDPPVFAPPLSVGEPLHTVAANQWSLYKETGMAIRDSGFWWLRWDLSPLGYLKTAAHGHLDALHLSIWFKGVAIVIDPGTGAYYADKALRSWLASRAAHNGPSPAGQEYPKRLGPFLWAQHHQPPNWTTRRSAESGLTGLIGELSLPTGCLRRCITRIEEGDSWQVEDELDSKPGNWGEFTVRWQFAPGSWLKRLEERKFSLHREGVSIVIEVGANWAEVNLVETASEHEDDLEGIVSPAFRKTVWAPYLKLTARGGKKPCVFRTTFLASQPP